VLRRKEPDAPRPYLTFGYPFTTIIVLAGCVALWIAAVLQDQRSGVFAALLLIACAPVYAWIARRRRRQGPGETAVADIAPPNPS